MGCLNHVIKIGIIIFLDITLNIFSSYGPIDDKERLERVKRSYVFIPPRTKLSSLDPFEGWSIHCMNFIYSHLIRFFFVHPGRRILNRILPRPSIMLIFWISFEKWKSLHSGFPFLPPPIFPFQDNYFMLWNPKSFSKTDFYLIL